CRPGAVSRLRRKRRSEAAHRETGALEDFRSARSRAPCVRFQSGAHGSRRDGLHGPQSQMPRLPDGEDVPVLSLLARFIIVKTIVVTAAIIRRDGRYLVTRRPPGTHLAGVWEFPGGKCDDGEPLTSCMARELDEELGTNATVGSETFTITHDYPDR